MSIVLRKLFCVTPAGSSAEAETLDPRLRTVLQTNGANVSPVNEYHNGAIAHSRKNPTFGKLLSDRIQYTNPNMGKAHPLRMRFLCNCRLF